jgi:germination protein M
MGTSRKPRKSSLGVLFWIAAILLISIVLMFSLPSIRQVMESTGFIDVVFEDGDGRSSREDPAPTEGPQATPPEPTRELEPIDPDVPLVAVPDDADDLEGVPQEADEEELDLTVPERPDEAEAGIPERTLRTTVYFIRVTDDGRIMAEPVTRTIRYTGGPLTQALEVLLAGPEAEDLNDGLLSLVPTGSRLLSARVDGGVAYLSFSEDFRFNTMGMEGHLAQLQQVVLTATAFSTVDAVQILIEGNTVDYLGGDGVFVGQPLRAEDFRG